MNIYTACPSFESDRYLLHPVQDNDAEALLLVYSDEKAVPLFNSDNCHGDDFHYMDLDRMRKAIDFWKQSYQNGQFVRWTLVDKTAGTAIGTVEGFRREAQDYFTDCALLRLDLRSDYETSQAIVQIFSLIAEPSFELFGCGKVAIKAIPAAQERIAAIGQLGFSASPEKLVGHDGTLYGDYFVLLRDKAFRQ
ncbi:MAG: GNAT family N-acetyltransferase [Treponema sp.]|nr:GNAT family N-acetyltransferase [Treponema sp.]